MHLVVVLVPCAALSFVATMWRPAWRRDYLWLVAAIALVGGVGAILAAQSGEALEDAIRAAAAAGHRPQLDPHPDQGDVAEMTSALFAFVVVGMWALQRFASQRMPAWAWTALYGAGVLAAIGALIAVVMAGDSGARLVWLDPGSFPGIK